MCSTATVIADVFVQFHTVPILQNKPEPWPSSVVAGSRVGVPAVPSRRDQSGQKLNGREI